MATIAVVGTLPGGALDGTIPYYHSYVLVTYDDGSQYFIRGGSSDGTEQGEIEGTWGEYLPGTVDYDDEGDDISSGPLVVGTDAEIQVLYDVMVARAEQINAEPYPYDAFINGTNAFVGELIDEIGVPRETAVPIGPDGNTLWLPAFFTPMPNPTESSRFEIMLDEYRLWVQLNALDNERGRMLLFSEAYLATIATSPVLVALARNDLDGWLELTYGRPAVVGSNANNSSSGTSGADLVVGLKGNDILTGLAGDDVLDGGTGNDTLDGGTGSDELRGGAGNDTYAVDSASDLVVEMSGDGVDRVNSSITYVIGTDIENLTLVGANAIDGTGNDADNVIAGNSGANILTGGGGADSLSGNGGADTLGGGDGNDTLSGGSENDQLDGGAGDDNLDGGSGSDQMSGGAGNDSYVIDNSGDRTNENADEGTDQVISSITLTLAANVENLTLLGSSGISGTGNSLGNVITGNSAANTLTGAEGGDTLNGNSGNDTLRGDGGDDALSGGAGLDSMLGGAGNDTYVVDASGDGVSESSNQGTDLVQSSITLTIGSNVENLTLTGTAAINGTGNGLSNTLVGNSGGNSLSGGSGDDVLNGGAGADRLTGGSGRDAFAFSGGSGADQVLDFADTNSSSNDDVLDLRGVGFTGVADVLDSVTVSGSNLVIDLGGGQSVTLVNYMQSHTLGQFGADDFLV